MEENHGFEDSLGGHVHQRRLGLSAMRLRDLLREATAIRQCCIKHANTKPNTTCSLMGPPSSGKCYRQRHCAAVDESAAFQSREGPYHRSRKSIGRLLAPCVVMLCHAPRQRVLWHRYLVIFAPKAERQTHFALRQGSVPGTPCFENIEKRNRRVAVELFFIQWCRST